MLTRLMVKNFKSIGEPGIDIELRPLTIFVGPNGGGKSSILEALAFLAQNLGRPVGSPVVSGELVQYPDISAIAHRLNQSRWVTIGFFVSKAQWGYAVSFRPDTAEARHGTLHADGTPVLEIELKGDLRRGRQAFLTGPRGPSQHSGVNELSFLDPYLFRQRALWPKYEQDSTMEESAKVIEHCAAELDHNVFLVKDLRGEIPYQMSTAVTPRWTGSRCENLLLLLSRVSSPAYEDVRNRVVRWASEFGLLKAWVGVTGSSLLAGEYVDHVLNVSLNLALASHGSRQVLGMITQLFWAKPGSIVMIEEPELSLHPEAQDKLPALFTDAIKDGKQVMITTHSHYLLLALTEAVKAGLPAEDIAVYEVKKEPETGTTAKRLPVSKEGYIKDWVSSFNQVDQELFARRTATRRSRSVKR